MGCFRMAPLVLSLSYFLLKHFCSTLSMAMRIWASSDILLSFFDFIFSDSAFSSICSTLISSSLVFFLEISLFNYKISCFFSLSYLSISCFSYSDLSSSVLLLYSRLTLASINSLYRFNMLPISSNSSGNYDWTISR